MGSPATCTHSLVSITSRRIIRPSSPTPHHQKALNLSLLDQLFPLTLYPTVLIFYSGDCFPSNNISESLQTSLSRALVHFASINCNDEGAYFLEAQVNCQLSDLLEHPNHSLLSNLSPESDPQTTNSALGSAVLLVQMSRFNCGGIALAVSPSHRIADGASCLKFVRAWAAIHRDDEYDRQIVAPQFDGASLLPAEEPFVHNYLGLPKYQSSTTRRFVFDVTKIASLKAKIEADTNVQVVSAIIVRSARAASRQVKPETSSSTAVLSQRVNLRPSMCSVVPENAKGNWVWPFHHVRFKPNEMELHELVANMRREIRDFYSKKGGNFNVEEDVFSMVAELFRERAELHRNTQGNIIVYRATSFCKFAVYEIDFGWGKPTWVTSQSNQKNIFALIDTVGGDGIEAWVTLDEEEMAIFERDEELLSFASVNPSVHHHSRM